MSELSNHVFINAKQFLNIARICQDAGRIDDVVMAAVANYAFSIELMLKALDTTVVSQMHSRHISPQAFVKTNIKGHDLESIYNKLPNKTKLKLSLEYNKISSGKNLNSQLSKFNSYFVYSRYSHDQTAQKTYDFSGLRELAEDLEWVINNWYMNPSSITNASRGTSNA